MTTGERIKRIRMVCDLTQSEFAKEIGVDKKSVSVWELDEDYGFTKEMIDELHEDDMVGEYYLLDCAPFKE